MTALIDLGVVRRVAGADDTDASSWPRSCRVTTTTSSARHAGRWRTSTLTEVGTRPWRGGTGGRRRTGLRGHRAPARPARALSGVSRISRKARLSRAGLQRPPAPESRSRSGPRTRPATPRHRRVLSAGWTGAVVAPRARSWKNPEDGVSNPRAPAFDAGPPLASHTTVSAPWSGLRSKDARRLRTAGARP